MDSTLISKWISWIFSCHDDKCKSATWLDHLSENWTKQNFHKLSIMSSQTLRDMAGIILCMRPANKRWRHSVTPSLIGWPHTQNDPWKGSLVSVPTLAELFLAVQGFIDTCQHHEICCLTFHHQLRIMVIRGLFTRTWPLPRARPSRGRPTCRHPVIGTLG